MATEFYRSKRSLPFTVDQCMQPRNQMIQRWLCELQEYSFIVSHRVEKLNGNTDALSRCPNPYTVDELEPCSKCWDMEKLGTVGLSDLQDEDLEKKYMSDFYQTDRYRQMWIVEGKLNVFRVTTFKSRGREPMARRQLINYKVKVKVGLRSFAVRNRGRCAYVQKSPHSALS